MYMYLLLTSHITKCHKHILSHIHLSFRHVQCTHTHTYTHQVLSSSVANALAYFGDTTKETEIFIRNFNRLFDCLNVRSLSEWYEKRNPDLKPYKSPDDPRLKVRPYYNYHGDYKIGMPRHYCNTCTLFPWKCSGWRSF